MQQTEQTKPKNNSPYPAASSPTGNNPYAAYQPAYTPKPDTVYTKTMKEHFSFFGIGSLLYAILSAFSFWGSPTASLIPRCFCFLTNAAFSCWLLF